MPLDRRPVGRRHVRQGPARPQRRQGRRVASRPPTATPAAAPVTAPTSPRAPTPSFTAVPETRTRRPFLSPPTAPRRPTAARWRRSTTRARRWASPGPSSCTGRRCRPSTSSTLRAHEPAPTLHHPGGHDRTRLADNASEAADRGGLPLAACVPDADGIGRVADVDDRLRVARPRRLPGRAHPCHRVQEVAKGPAVRRAARVALGLRGAAHRPGLGAAPDRQLAGRRQLATRAVEGAGGPRMRRAQPR